MSVVLSNRQVIEKLKTLPGNEPFGSVGESDKVTRKFLETLYDPLKKLFAKAPSNSSRANARQIQKIEEIKISQRDRFSEYRENIPAFWENDVKNIHYFDEEDESKVKAFLKSACRLNKNVTELLILRRFVDLATYKLYRRIFPEALVWEEKVREFLKLAHISDPDDSEVADFCDIIRRGKRERDFCIELARKTNTDDEDESEEENNSIYGPLFVDHIPDAIWDRGGLKGNDFKESVEKLCQLWNEADKALTAEATEVAKLLLDHHAISIVCYSEQAFDKGKRRTRHYGEAHRTKLRRSQAINRSTFASPVSRTQDSVSSREYGRTMTDSPHNIKTRKRTGEKEQGSRKKLRSSYHQSPSAPQRRDDDNIGPRQLDPSTEEAALLLSTIRDGQANLSGNQQSLPAHASHAHHSSAEAERSRDPSLSAADIATSSTGATETTLDIDDGSDIMSSEATSILSISGEAPHHWTSSLATGCNSQFQPVNDGSSAEHADFLTFTFRSPQGMETNQNYAYYAQLPVTATAQPEVHLGTANLAQSRPLPDNLVDVETLAYTATNEISFNEQSQQPARAIQDGTQSHVPCGLQFTSQGFEEIHFDIQHPTDPDGFEAVSFDSQGNAWLAVDSQGFEQVSFSGDHTMVSW
ncbi:hypothetical protein EYB26_005300 [Talaromyces marneffei]|uniref:uncharacterized protein n=1 Tax=Talaromyces marneffei TaxID=37727 RepID=UPI0012A8458B|nr:uncharacterized protein EYB26_005300 [Talaromyces marneffei]QGA17625.1 hypothetical protein EYB26_005300 [Talaromyces marneffei]